ncbi:nucleotidyltransferase [Spirochaeta thermophila DSM 6192]|uniref:Nucleotidyltransferase n=2 Tax=Winmispira thermophila TaxID=154 RepID=E0RN24_WINT6|nr:nucleotidyltransferase [Spirochaeta thermophila DSM 6192]
MRDSREYLRDMLDAISKIERHRGKGYEAFKENELIQVWMLYHLQIIGEAAARVDKDLRARTPFIPWEKIVGMRNLLVHEYFGIDLDEVWYTVEHDIPSLKASLERLLDER